MNHYDYVTTYSGKKLTFLDPKPEDILLEDIAHCLANICRYNGATKYHYSVAQHSCNVSAMVFARTKDPEQALAALMHDASEAYLCDIPRPIKPHLKGYKEIEDNLLKAILEKFEIEEPGEVVWEVDTNIVADEAEVLFKVVPDWVNDYEKVGLEPFMLEEIRHDQAVEGFMATYQWLKEKIDAKFER